MLHPNQRKLVWALMAALFLFGAVLSELLRPGHAEYVRAGRTVTPGTDFRYAKLGGSDSPFEALLPTVLGIREVLASLMWVRADDYFHRGEYRPIIRLVRQITLIDPHQLDVYATGAWHMAYNFMDKRLIEEGVRFLEEGCQNNQSVYDLWFELGYMHYDKTKDFPKAVEAYRTGASKGTTTGKPYPPSFVRHQLAHALEKMGDIDQCLEQWRVNLARARELEAKGEERMGPAGTNSQAARHNLYITARRRNERLAMLAEREKNAAEALRLWQANVELAQEWLREFPKHPNVSDDLRRAENEVERLRAGRLRPVPPTDPELRFTVRRIAPRQLLIEGRANVLDLSRVHVRFQDRGYDERAARGFEFKMANCTLEWENVSVRGGKFRYLLNLNRDPAEMDRPPAEIYPLEADAYELSVTYNPRTQAAFIQDRYGWNGEGLTAKPGYLRVDASRAGIIDGKRYPLRTVTKTIVLRREDILGEGKKLLYAGS